MKLTVAQSILAGVLDEAAARGLKPLAVAVLDARGALRALLAQDGTSNKRAEIAIGKANAAISMGLGTRDVAKRPPHFLAAVTHAVGGVFVPVPGGVLIKDSGGEILGAVGISGDTSDNDEAAAVAGISGQGLVADTGA